MEKNIRQKSICTYWKNSLLLLLIFTTYAINAQDAASYFEKGKAFYEKEEYGEATSHFEKAVKNEESNADYHYWVGVSNIAALEDASMFQKAMISYDAKSSLLKAIELQPSHKLARVRLANYYIQAPAIAGGSYSKALEQANELKKYDAIAAAELEATVYLQQEEFDQAEKVYKQLIASGNNNEKVYYRLSVVCLSRNDFKQALDYCQKSIDNYPDYLMGFYQFGKVASLGKIELQTALKHLDAYIAMDTPDNLPKKHWAHLRQGKIYEHLNNATQANISYEKALELEKGFKEAKSALNALNN